MTVASSTRRFGRPAVALAAPLLLLLSTWMARSALYDAGPRPSSERRELAPGVDYEREVLLSPRPAILHWVRIDLQSGHTLLVTPAEPSGGSLAHTASEALDVLDADLAIDANFYTHPQCDLTPWHDFPRSGERVYCLGVALSPRGVLCDEPWEDGATLFVPERGVPSVGQRPDDLQLAVSGRYVLARDGRETEQTTLDPEPYPRAALGLDERAEVMTWVVVDGHVEGSREGLSLHELTERMIARGVWSAIELDGGGSAELARRRDGRPEPLSLPTHREVPGWERPVAVHLALRFRRE